MRAAAVVRLHFTAQKAFFVIPRFGLYFRAFRRGTRSQHRLLADTELFQTGFVDTTQVPPVWVDRPGAYAIQSAGEPNTILIKDFA